MFVSLAYFQKYERFVDKSAKVLMAESVPLTSDRMFVVVVVVGLLFYVHGKHLRSCRDGQLT